MSPCWPHCTGGKPRMSQTPVDGRKTAGSATPSPVKSAAPGVPNVPVGGGGGATPVPLRTTVCGLLAASSVIATLAVRLPLAVGANVMEIVHVMPGAKVAGLSGQLWLGEKSLAVAPVTLTPAIVSGAVPVFVSVVVWAALAVPTSCDAKLRVVGVSATAGAGVVPVPL